MNQVCHEKNTTSCTHNVVGTNYRKFWPSPFFFLFLNFYLFIAIYTMVGKALKLNFWLIKKEQYLSDDVTLVKFPLIDFSHFFVYRRRRSQYKLLICSILFPYVRKLLLNWLIIGNLMDKFLAVTLLKFRKYKLLWF